MRTRTRECKELKEGEKEKGDDGRREAQAHRFGLGRDASTQATNTVKINCKCYIESEKT